MSDPGETSVGDRPGARQRLESAASRTTEAYECEDGVVFYDAENPLAWLQASEAIDLPDAA